MNNHAVAQIVAGLVIIGLLAWLTTIGPNAGNLAVAIVLALWFLWGVKNASSIRYAGQLIGV